jgi:hypothetical protein
VNLEAKLATAPLQVLGKLEAVYSRYQAIIMHAFMGGQTLDDGLVKVHNALQDFQEIGHL